MVNHGTVRSSDRPERVDIKETLVLTAEDIHEIEVTDDQGTHTEYEFTLTEYNKDEYIKLMAEHSESLEFQLTDAQLALCDIYEALV